MAGIIDLLLITIEFIMSPRMNIGIITSGCMCRIAKSAAEIILPYIIPHLFENALNRKPLKKTSSTIGAIPTITTPAIIKLAKLSPNNGSSFSWT